MEVALASARKEIGVSRRGDAPGVNDAEPVRPPSRLGQMLQSAGGQSNVTVSGCTRVEAGCFDHYRHARQSFTKIFRQNIY